MVQEFHADYPSSTKVSNTCNLGEVENAMPQIKTWKTRPANFVLLEILGKKGDLTDDELFNQLSSEFEDLGFKDFNNLLLSLEVSGKIRTSGMSRGKRRIEIVQ
jgi:hypothetical protein